MTSSDTSRGAPPFIGNRASVETVSYPVRYRRLSATASSLEEDTPSSTEPGRSSGRDSGESTCVAKVSEGRPSHAAE